MVLCLRNHILHLRGHFPAQETQVSVLWCSIPAMLLCAEMAQVRLLEAVSGGSHCRQAACQAYLMTSYWESYTPGW
jgi:hypothetical protein